MITIHDPANTLSVGSSNEAAASSYATERTVLPTGKNEEELGSYLTSLFQTY
jgi:hypothetical protein